VGFGSGHSSLMWLSASPGAKLTVFDGIETDRVPNAIEWLKGQASLHASERLTLVGGDTAKSVHKQATDHPNFRCDIVSFDGRSHALGLARWNLRSFIRLSRPCCTVGFIDGTPLLRSTAAWAAEPLQALGEATLDKRACPLLNVDSGPNQGLTMFHFLHTDHQKDPPGCHRVEEGPGGNDPAGPAWWCTPEKRPGEAGYDYGAFLDAALADQEGGGGKHHGGTKHHQNKVAEEYWAAAEADYKKRSSGPLGDKVSLGAKPSPAAPATPSVRAAARAKAAMAPGQPKGGNQRKGGKERRK